MSFTHIHHHYHLLRMTEMRRIYWCHSIGAIGVSLAAIFVPIFLLKSGYSFQSVLIFLVLQQLFALVLQLPISRFATHLQPHHLLALGKAWYVVFFALLATLNEYNWPLAILALAWALNRTCYWTAFHYCFASARAHKRSSIQIARLTAFNMIATTLAPAIGGITATVFGITYVYVFAAATLVISVLPVLFSTNGPKPPRLRLSWRLVRTARRDMLANAFNGIVVTAEMSVWPLFVYLLVSSYAGIGALSSIIAVISAIVTLYVGKKTKKAHGRQFIRRGLVTHSLTNIGRSLAENTAQVFGLNVLGGIGRSLYVTPYMNRYYHNSDGSQRFAYITLMETALPIGALLYLGSLTLLSLFLPDHAVLSIGLIIVAAGTLGVRLIR